MQMVVYKSDAEVIEERRTSIFCHLSDAPNDFKRQRIDGDTKGAGPSRSCLREALIAKATEFRQKNERVMDDRANSANHSEVVEPRPKKIRLQGNDAITRLVNLGR